MSSPTRAIRGSACAAAAALLSLSIGCGSGAVGASPCDSDTPPPECGTTCTSDDACGPLLYCGTDGTCTADCTVGGPCAGGTCGEHGRCIPDPADAGIDSGNGCPDVQVSLQPTTPIVVLLIDQSGSMVDPFGGGTRWEGVVSALVDDGGVVPTLQDSVIFGATLYTSVDGDAGGACPVLTTVDPALGNFGPINDLLRNNEPVDETPTGESIEQVILDFNNIPVDPERPKPRVIVLCTDGEPDTCASPNPQEGQPEAVAAAQAAFTAGIRTYILSVGSEIGEPHQRDMANAGVGLPIGGAEQAPFYVANDPEELVAKFDEIIRGVRTCTFELDGNVELDQAGDGQVTLNGGVLVYGTDWQMIDENTLELLGDACDEFLDTDVVDLEAEFPCGAIVD